MEKRLDLKVGYSCNNNCLHCVIAYKRKLGNKTTKQILKEMEEEKCNFNQITITGGEPTIRTDFLEIISCAKKFYDFVQLQTNGRMFAYENFTKEVVGKIDEVVPAVHGHKAVVHDRITKVRGSWNQTVQGIKNLKNYSICVYANVVVSKLNYKILPQLADFLIKLNVDKMQFAFLHPDGNALEYANDLVPRVTEAVKFIHKAIDVAEASGILATVEAVPFCLMKEYKKNVAEQYLPDNIEVKDVGRTVKDFLHILKSMGRVKDKRCENCKFFSSCLGPWKEYVELKGFEEFRPVI